jgi:anti-sigma-K factor RskA
MRHDDPENRDMLAAEYVLGTLHGAARRRFERLLAEDADLQREVAAWESRLGPLAAALPPIAPPPAVWEAISRRIEDAPAERPSKSPAHRWNSLALWRGLALAASLAAIALFVQLLIGPALIPSPELASADYVGVVSDEEEQPLWVIRASARARQLSMKVMRPVDMPPNSACELWLVTADGSTRSLGILPERGSRTVALPAVADAIRGEAAQLAVSIEPAGGSPQGEPTGPIVYRGTLLTSG